jgi:hypothetical protein
VATVVGSNLPIGEITFGYTQSLAEYFFVVWKAQQAQLFNAV